MEHFDLADLQTIVVMAIAAVAATWAWAYRAELAAGVGRLRARYVAPRAEDDAGEHAGTDTTVPGRNQVEALPDAVPAGTEGGTGSPPAIVVSGVSRSMSDVEIVAVLAVQREGRGWKFSANKIYSLVGGNRAAVLDQVAAIRATPYTPAEGRRPPAPATPAPEFERVDPAGRQLRRVN